MASTTMSRAAAAVPANALHSERCFLYFGKVGEEERDLLTFIQQEGAIPGVKLLPKIKKVQADQKLLSALGIHLINEFRQRSLAEALADLRRRYDSVFAHVRQGEDDIRDRFFSGDLSAAKRRNIGDFDESKLIPGSKPNVWGIEDADKVMRLLIVVPAQDTVQEIQAELDNMMTAEQDIVSASVMCDTVKEAEVEEPAAQLEVLAAPSNMREEPGGEPTKQPTAQQAEVIQKLLDRAKARMGDKRFESYTEVRMMIVTPRFVSLRGQTCKRVCEYGVASSVAEARTIVVPHDISNFFDWVEFQSELLDEKNANTLFVIVDDECHYGPTADMAHDVLVNFSLPSDKDKVKMRTKVPSYTEMEKKLLLKQRDARKNALLKKNLIVLQVSATPQNCLTKYSRIPRDNIVEWTYESESLLDLGLDDVNTSLYRSLDCTVETFCWRLLDEKAARKLDPTLMEDARRFELKDPNDRIFVVQDLGAELKHFSFAPYDFFDFWRVSANVFRREGLSEDVIFTTDDDSGEPRLQLTFPRKGWSLKSNRFTRELLGFGESHAADGSWIEPDDHKILIGMRLPSLCEPSQGGSRPQAYQHIRADESVHRMIKEWATGRKKSEKAKAPKKKQRLSRGTTGGTDGAAEAADEDSENDANAKSVCEHETHLLIADYMISLAYFAFFRLKPAFYDSTSSRPTDGPVLAEMTGDTPDPSLARVGEMLVALEKVKTDSPDWSNKEKPLDGFPETLSFVMKDFEEEAKDTLNMAEEQDKVKLWAAIIKEKRQAEANSLASNDRISWYTESDRLVRTLLDVNEPCDGESRLRKGRMAFTRVYGTDRALLLQLHLRNVMKMFRLYYGQSNGSQGRPFFAVLSDNGDVRLEHEMGLEQWADVYLGAQRDKGKDTSTFTKRLQANEFPDYDVLKDIPCLVLLCQKGRMGDTFPQTLSLIDVRGRMSANGKYTSMVQEFGRLCRYPMVDEAWMHVVDDDKFGDELMEKLTRSMEADHPIALFRPNDNVPSLDSITKKSLVEDRSKFLGQAEFPQQLDALQGRARVGDVLLRYLYPLPTLLVGEAIWDLLRDAVQRRNNIALDRQLLGSTDLGARILRNLPRIMECIHMDLDQYMEKETKNKRCDVESLDETRTKLLDVYRSDYKPSDKHFDTTKADPHDGRLLLFAECQMGKTGVFLGFLRKLQEQCTERSRNSLRRALESLLHAGYDLDLKKYNIPLPRPTDRTEWESLVAVLTSTLSELRNTMSIQAQDRRPMILFVAVGFGSDEEIHFDAQWSFAKSYIHHEVGEARYLVVLGPSMYQLKVPDLKVPSFSPWTDDTAVTLASAADMKPFFVKCYIRTDTCGGVTEGNGQAETVEAAEPLQSFVVTASTTTTTPARATSTTPSNGSLLASLSQQSVQPFVGAKKRQMEERKKSVSSSPDAPTPKQGAKKAKEDLSHGTPTEDGVKKEIVVALKLNITEDEAESCVRGKLSDWNDVVHRDLAVKQFTDRLIKVPKELQKIVAKEKLPPEHLSEFVDMFLHDVKFTYRNTSTASMNKSFKLGRDPAIKMDSAIKAAKAYEVWLEKTSRYVKPPSTTEDSVSS